MGKTEDPDHAVGIDDLELEAAGYSQQMPRRFSPWSLGALSFTLTCTWLGTGSSIGIGLAEASAAGALWALPIAGVMTLIVSAGMAELASAYPVAGAQYYWTFMIASDKYKAFGSFVNGWMSIIGWWLASGSVANFNSSMILEIVTVWYPSFQPQHWQQYLIYVALIWLATALNILGSRWLPHFNQFIFLLSVATLAATTMTLFIVARGHHAPASFIFADTVSQSGWASEGFSFLLAISNSVYGFLGSDCGAHLCEEIANPSRNVPKAILYPLVVGLLTAFPFTISLIYSITDVNAVLEMITGLPLIEIYYQGTGSYAAASVLLAAFAFCLFGCLVGVGTTCSRTLWAVSRDGALPFSHLWMHVHPKFHMPANAMVLTASCVSLYGLIFLGSTTAFSAMVSATIMFTQTSCVIPQAILLYRGRDQVLPKRYFDLGRFGTLVNATAVAWTVFLDILVCFPTSMPVSVENMNYVSVVFVGLASFVVLLWFSTKRGVFMGPHVNVGLMNERRLAALQTDTVDAERDDSKAAESRVSYISPVD
ncbi:amino acid transporter [Trichoderma gracile]